MEKRRQQDFGWLFQEKFQRLTKDLYFSNSSFQYLVEQDFISSLLLFCFCCYLHLKYLHSNNKEMFLRQLIYTFAMCLPSIHFSGLYENFFKNQKNVFSVLLSPNILVLLFWTPTTTEGSLYRTYFIFSREYEC